MATQVIRNEAVISVPQQGSESWKRFKKAFSSVRGALAVVFSEHNGIESLSSEYRSGLSGRERMEVDSDLLGLPRH